jgi:ABC-type nitrate/sulfonate/bicarbonate transport system permease component
VKPHRHPKFLSKTLQQAVRPAVGLLLPLGVFLILWQAGSLLLGVSRLPSVWETFSAFFGSMRESPIIQAQGGGSGGYLPHALTTFQNFSLGLLAGLTIGAAAALLIYQHRAVQELLDPLLETFRVLPPLIAIPFVLVVFHSTNTTQIIVGALYSSYSVCVYTLNGLQNIERNYLRIAELSGSNRIQKILKVEIPAVMPELVGALRITSPLTLGIIVVAEYLGAPLGIGRVLKFAISFSRIDLIMVGIVWVIAIAILVDTIIALIFHFLLRWSSRFVQR